MSAPTYPTRAQSVTDAWQQNERLAEDNLALCDEMSDLSNQIAIVRSSEFVPAEARFRELYARQQSILEHQAPKVRLEKGWWRVTMKLWYVALERVCACMQTFICLISSLFKVLLERLERAAADAEAASDALLAQPPAASEPLEAWIDRYLRARTAFHLRDIKLKVARQTIPQAV